jgi:hypothetical protein
MVAILSSKFQKTKLYISVTMQWQMSSTISQHSSMTVILSYINKANFWNFSFLNPKRKKSQRLSLGNWMARSFHTYCDHNVDQVSYKGQRCHEGSPRCDVAPSYISNVCLPETSWGIQLLCNMLRYCLQFTVWSKRKVWLTHDLI